MEEAEIETAEVKFLYKTPKNEYFFCDAIDPSKRFSMTEEIVGPGSRFLKPNTILTQKIWNEKPIGFEFPISVELKVTEAPPNIKGDSATGGSKVVTLENGATINTPLFINEGDVIRINTETGEYRERVTK